MRSKPPRPKLTVAQIDEIIRLHDSGMVSKIIARQMGLDYEQVVYQWNKVAYARRLRAERLAEERAGSGPTILAQQVALAKSEQAEAKPFKPRDDEVDSFIGGVWLMEQRIRRGTKWK